MSRSTTERSTPAARIPPNVFGIGFGLGGLATAWRIAGHFHLVPARVCDVLCALAALVWFVSLTLYVRAALQRKLLIADFRDMTFGPFLSLALITPLILTANGVAPHARTAAAVVVDVLAVAVVLLGGWFTGFWMQGGTELDRLHPGYFLPTVAGGLVASAAACSVGQRRFGEVLLGLGLICWAILGSLILSRLIFRPRLPDALLPTMAIEVAPAGVASIAYFAINGGHVDVFAAVLAGYGLLMVCAQLPLLPRFLRLHFSLGTWAFAFSWSAVASTLIYWLGLERPSGHRWLSVVVLVVISGFVAGLAGRTVLAIAKGQLLPAPAPRSASATASPTAA